MGVPLSKELQDFLREPVFAHMATLNSDGSPRGAMMWVESDGTHLIVNNPLPSVKVINIKRDPRVFITIQPTMEYPRRTFQFAGRVVEMSTKGANAHIDAMAEKYVGVARYPRRTPGTKRKFGWGIRLKVSFVPNRFPY